MPSIRGYEIDGEVTDQFPVTPRLMRAKPVFTTLPGWKCDIRGCKDYDALPQQAKDYVDFLEQHIQCPITNMDAVKLMGEIVLETAKATKDQDSLGCCLLYTSCKCIWWNKINGIFGT